MQTKIAAAAFLSLSLIPYVFPSHANAQAATDEEQVVVTGDDIGSAYGAPGAFSRTRLSPTTTAYVLPPWTFYFGTIYEGDAFRHGPPDHMFTQEIEMGLPGRFGVAVETSFERFNGGGGPASTSIEARYALADWGKIPLNPTLFAEYKFGVGKELASPGNHLAEGDNEESSTSPANIPNGYEIRLLLGEQFGKKTQWALNIFDEQAV